MKNFVVTIYHNNELILNYQAKGVAGPVQATRDAMDELTTQDPKAENLSYLKVIVKRNHRS